MNIFQINWISDPMRLARSSTCSSLLILNQTYNPNSQLLFERELDFAFFYSEGFDEVIYRSAYNQIDRETHQLRTTNNDIPTIDLTINNDTPIIDLTTNEEIMSDQNQLNFINEGMNDQSRINDQIQVDEEPNESEGK